MIRLMLTAVALAASGAAFAKLPPLDDAAKAKAAETAARAAWQAKLDNFQLCKAQDRVAAQYRKTAAASGKTTNAPGAGAPAVTVATAPAAAPAAARGATPAATATAAAQPGTPATAAAAANAATAAQGAGTPVNVAAAPTSLAACMDPGPFAYSPPEQKPLETSGAHSPAGTAASPPSVRPESAKLAPSGPATPQSKKN
jgi:hypothetical protein